MAQSAADPSLLGEIETGMRGIECKVPKPSAGRAPHPGCNHTPPFPGLNFLFKSKPASPNVRFRRNQAIHSKQKERPLDSSGTSSNKARSPTRTRERQALKSGSCNSNASSPRPALPCATCCRCWNNISVRTSTRTAGSVESAFAHLRRDQTTASSTSLRPTLIGTSMERGRGRPAALQRLSKRQMPAAT